MPAPHQPAGASLSAVLIARRAKWDGKHAYVCAPMRPPKKESPGALPTGNLVRWGPKLRAEQVTELKLCSQLHIEGEKGRAMRPTGSGVASSLG
jgi:hypothetical protein